MGRAAEILYKDVPAGILTEDENGYTFEYYESYYNNKSEPVSLTFPVTEKKYTSPMLFPFFDGLIPEGWLLAIAENTWFFNSVLPLNSTGVTPVIFLNTRLNVLIFSIIMRRSLLSSTTSIIGRSDSARHSDYQSY